MSATGIISARNAERGIIGELIGTAPSQSWNLVEAAGLTARHFHDVYSQLFAVIASYVHKNGVARLDVMMIQDALQNAGMGELIEKLEACTASGSVPSRVPDYIAEVLAVELKQKACSQLEDAQREIAAASSVGLEEVVSRCCTDFSRLTEQSLGIKIHGRSLSDFYALPIDPSKTLLGNRYLCKEGGMLFVGPSGVGKSSASVQQDLLWALGRPAFGICPARPLRVVCIQAENDDGDLIEIVNGVVSGLALSAEELKTASANTVYISEKALVGDAFIRHVRKVLRQFRPDILRIDPLQAFLGADPKDSEAVSRFCRNGLNPLLAEYQAGCILNHHTPKTNFRDSKNWDLVSWMYAGAGTAELTNWARAVLVVDMLKAEDRTFAFIAAKRGPRIGWVSGDGSKASVKFFRHARADTAIFWEETEIAPKSNKASPPRTKKDLLAIVPMDQPIEQRSLLSKAKTGGIGENRARGFLAELLDSAELHVWTTKRSGTNPLKMIARSPQPKEASHAG